jgi:hypothetical protein
LRHELIHRQVALVSYGTGFLRNENTLEDWYRHDVFHGARSVFRTSADNALLADDFTLWLSILKGAGALRLSLHPAEEFALRAPRDERRAGYAVVAHYADHYQIWTVGQERPAWAGDAAFNAGQDVWHYFHAKGAGAIDSYWSSEPMPGNLQVPATDWQTLATAIGADLDRPIPSSLARAGPFMLHGSGDRTRRELPLFAMSDAASLAQRVVASLDAEQGKFANDTHPKNEGNLFNYLNEQEAAQLTQWGERLDNWMIEVLIRGANDGAGAGVNDRSGNFRRLQLLSADGANEAAADVDDVKAVAAPLPQAVHESPPTGKWGQRIALGIMIAIFSSIFVVIAHIIAAFPWLAFLIGLPFALHLHYKDKDRQG